MKIKIVRKNINELHEQEIKSVDKFINDNNGLIFHEISFNQIVSEVFKTKFIGYFAFLENEMIGFCPVHSVKNKFITYSFSNNGSYEIPYGGWVFNENLVNFKYLWNNTNISYCESLTYTTFSKTILSEKQKGKPQIMLTGLVDLNKDLEYIWNSCINSKRRNMILKAIKSKVIIKILHSEGLEDFVKLLNNMKQKAGLKLNDFDYYDKIFTKYTSEFINILLAFQDEKLLSGLILIGNKNVKHYWLGASIPGAPNIGQGELLQWEAIKHAKLNGTKLYDLCVIEKERLPNIAKFKMDFTNEIQPFYIFNKKTLTHRVLNRINKFGTF